MFYSFSGPETFFSLPMDMWSMLRQVMGYSVSKVQRFLFSAPLFSHLNGAEKRTNGAEKRTNGAEKRTNGAEKKTNGAGKRKCTLGRP